MEDKKVKENCLNKAKNEKNDEFYTLYSSIEAELRHYSDKFKGKKVLCNCNDSNESQFYKYFVNNFENIGIKSITGIEYCENGRAREFVYDEHGETVSLLNGNGDCFSKECRDILDGCDVVVTNPPFSKFRNYFQLLISSGKEFLILGNINAATYKEVFPYIKNNKVWLGSGDNHLSMWYKIPDEYKRDGKGLFVDENGERLWHICGIVWYTNIDSDFRHKPIDLKSKYDDGKYKYYDNVFAIDVARYNKIPYDYDGLIGVPISFLDKYCPEQFEIVGNEYDFGLEKGRCYMEGKRMYSRIFIKKKN